MKKFIILILGLLTFVSCSEESITLRPTEMIVYYRLYQVDYDGNYEIFETRVLLIGLYNRTENDSILGEDPTVPITLSSFKVYDNGNGSVTIKYTTDIEVNSDYVIIQASLDMREWVDVVKMKSLFPNGGKYQYVDKLYWIE